MRGRKNEELHKDFTQMKTDLKNFNFILIIMKIYFS